MAAESSELLVPDDLGLDGAESRLAAALRLEAGAVESADRTFYDTFDGRLHAAGLHLVQEDARLKLADGPPENELAGAAYKRMPRSMLIADVPAGRLRDLLAPVIEMRALTPIARIRSRLQPLRVLDREAKTVVRLVLEEPELVTASGASERLPPRLRVDAVRGYDAALARVTRSLAELGFVAAESPLLDAAVTLAGGVPGGVSSRLDVVLQPGQRADDAAVVLLDHLFETMMRNLPGTLADVDSEFLHNFRVAVRRTRSAQRQLRGVFPPDALAGFRAEFRWLQQVTGPTRDLDVHLLELDELGKSRADVGVDNLEPVRRLLAGRRRDEQRRLVRALRSRRAESLLYGWPVFLGGLLAWPEDERPDAARPIVELAGERISRVYRGMVKAGGAIDGTSPPEALHDLRKTGKELRYLLEFFDSLFPAEVVKPMVRTLKALQDTLGRYQDREVQAEALRSLGGDIAGLDGGPASLMAMGVLVERLERDKVDARSEFAERFAAFAAKPQRTLVREVFA